MLENQIYAIEAANINQETLTAMKNAGKAMKDIHGNLTMDKIDTIMYVAHPLREQSKFMTLLTPSSILGFEDIMTDPKLVFVTWKMLTRLVKGRHPGTDGPRKPGWRRHREREPGRSAR